MNHTRDAFVTAHEYGHFIHGQYLMPTSYGRFGEMGANTFAAISTGSPWKELTGGRGLNMDANGRRLVNTSGIATSIQRPRLRRFFRDVAAAAAAAKTNCSAYTIKVDPFLASDGSIATWRSCCDAGTASWWKPGWDKQSADSRIADCVMRDLDTMYWDENLYVDLHDGTGEEPVLSFSANGPLPALQATSGYDKVDGRGSSATPTDHRLMDVFLKYLGKTPHTAYVDRGRERLDLVDVLDGAVCRKYADEMRDGYMVNTVYSADYDFRPINDSCQ